MMRGGLEMRGAIVRALGAALVVVACGAPTTPAATSAPVASATGVAASAQATAAPTSGITTVRATTLKLCNEPYLYWAIEKGIFEKHGLKVEPVQSTGGSAGIAAIVSGSADFSFTNGFTAILSYAQGFPVKFVAATYETPVAPKPEANAVIVRANSSIQGPKDLAGKRIGVNELGGINQIVVSAWLRKNGVDPTAANFVALPFPQLVPAVVQGQLDAAQVPVVNIPAAQASSLRNLGDPYRQAFGRILFAGYLATNDFIAKHPGVAEKFQAALAESVQQIEDPKNATAAFEVMGKVCGQDPKVLATQPQQEYEASIDMSILQTMANTLVQEGYIRQAPDLGPFVPDFARKRP